MFKLIEKTCYILLILWVILYISAILAVTFNLLPASVFIWTSILMIIALALLFIKVLVERINNKEDSHYSKKVRR